MGLSGFKVEEPVLHPHVAIRAIMRLMIYSNFGSVMMAQAMAEQSAQKKAQKHIKRALKELELASKYSKIELTLTADQLRQIDEARARGGKAHISISLS